MPIGGMTATQSVTPVGQMTPADIAALVDQLTPASQKFRAQSTIQKVTLSDMVWNGQGQPVTVQIAQVGLGKKTRTWHHIVITLNNAGTASQSVKLSPWFPFNLLSNSIVKINGGAAVYSASGDGGLVASARRNRSFFNLSDPALTGVGPGLPNSMCAINVGANGTITNAVTGGIPAQLSGIASIAIAAGTSCIVTVDFTTEEWFVYDDETLLGCLPLQNSSTYATLQRTLASQFITASAGDSTKPFYNAGANMSLSALSGTSKTEYEFASVPSDATLYASLVSNSYQVTEQSQITGTAGQQGLQYNLPQNEYLIALHRILVDSTGIPIAFSDGNIGSQTAEATNYMTAAFSANERKIQYNGGKVIPVDDTPARLQELQYRTYGDERARVLAGYLLWDGNDTVNDIQAASDDMNWIDSYNVASPQAVEAIGGSVANTPIVARFIRESLVSGSVQVVGG